MARVSRNALIPYVPYSRPTPEYQPDHVRPSRPPLFLMHFTVNRFGALALEVDRLLDGHSEQPRRNPPTVPSDIWATPNHSAYKVSDKGDIGASQRLRSRG
jgi:hypothetical protein